MRRFLQLAIVALAFVVVAPAADITGFWLGSTNSGRRNRIQDFAFQFIQNGNVLTGKVYLEYGTAPILKGTVEGDQIKFEVVAREQDGNEINASVLKFTGVFKDGEIEIKRERDELRNAVNNAAFVSRAGAITFTIKRLP